MSAYAALAELHRRRILDLLREGERPAGELVHSLELGQPGVSKHLKVLREAGLVAVRAEGKRRLVFEAGGATGEIIELEAPHRIAWTFAGELFRFELRAEESGCLLVFTHVFDDRTLAAQTAAGWEAYLSRLEPHLAGHPLSEEEAHEPWAEVHELYAQLLAIDPTAGRRFIAAQRHPALTLEDGPILRLERRYRHDPERLWSALTDPQELAHCSPLASR